MSPVHLRLEDERSPSFAQEVVDILNSTFELNSETSPSDAAIAIDSLLNQDYQEDEIAGGFLWWFWDLVHDLARQVPFDGPEQNTLVAVIKALQDLPPKTMKLGEDWGCDDPSNTRVDPIPPTKVERRERRINLQTYVAKVAGLCNRRFQLYAIWALVRALEGTMIPIRGAPDKVNEDPAADINLPEWVKISSTWMAHAGHQLYGRDEEIYGATAGPLWKLDKKEGIKLRRKFKGTNGLCPRRWKLWKERFGVIRDTDGVDAEARRDAGDAYRAMERIEGSQQ
ncbi:hypothetical protein B0T10DRAFT_522256 [Thelonectria olida]|uniref:Uncharacterized protein n=1 Tax=Thelonectria olida TaxID=1576542 RepID=A0A9P9AI84_9HYPO|nr:hypothetical protein B0T10DRAFT_522256 [Thelonectria olida]